MPSKFDPQKHHRRSIRLKGYDYSQPGAYFVTIVAHQRECLFGEVVDGKMYLNEHGKIVQKWWNEIPKHFPNVEIIAFVIMPNHIHGIIVITVDRRGTVPVPQIDGQIPEQIDMPNNRNELTAQLGVESANWGGVPPPQRVPTLGQIVAYFKYQSTKEMNLLAKTDIKTKFWQRNYYEHVIRNEREMQNIFDYIESNPINWTNDTENPLNK